MKVVGKYSLNSGPSLKIEKVSLKLLCLMYIASVDMAKSGSPKEETKIFLSSISFLVKLLKLLRYVSSIVIVKRAIMIVKNRYLLFYSSSL